MELTFWQNTRIILFLAFGGLLLLIAGLGLQAYQRSDGIYRDVTSIQETYRQRAAVLNEIPTNIFSTAVLVRDYLLDPATSTGNKHRRQLLEIRQSLGEHLKNLERLSTSQDRELLRQMGRELEGYWSALDPMFGWTPEHKAALSSSFLNEQVLPRRVALLKMTRGIGQLNAANLAREQERLADSWGFLRNYLKWMFAYALCLALFTAVISISRVSTLEKRAGEHRMSLVEAQQRLRELSQRLLHTQEDERKFLSRELHDEIGQMLTGIRMVFGNLEQLRTAPEGDFRNHLSEGKRLAEQALQMVRNLALGLRPSMLDDLGLEPALEWQAREFSRRSGTPVEFKTDGPLENIPEEIRTCIYRVVQESLTNCARHARSKSILINLCGGRTELSLTVQDDGIGFKAECANVRGLGLFGINERIRELGGKVTIASQPGIGTTLHAVLPLK